MNPIDEIRKARMLIIESHLAQTGNKKCKICNIWMHSDFIAEDGTCEECNPKELKVVERVIEF